MKKCVHCGCYNQDNRVMCADCGQILAGAEQISETELELKLEKLSRYSDPFSFKPRHQVVFYASFLLIAANIILAFLSRITPDIVFLSVLCFIICIISARFSEIIWSIEKFFLQFRVSGEIEPSDWWFISREIEIFLFFGLGVILFLFGITGNTLLYNSQ